MHHISFQQKERLGRAAPNLSGNWQVEALVPVPVPGHPQAEHFVVCGASHHEEPLPADELANFNRAAERVSVKEIPAQRGEPAELVVVYDGKYIAGGFTMKHDYSDRPAQEIQAAQRAVTVCQDLAANRTPGAAKAPAKNLG